MDPLFYDLRSGLRILLKSPGPAAVAVLVLALGLGLATAMFAIIDGTVFKTLPVEDGHKIMAIYEVSPSGRRAVPVEDFVAWREQQTSFEDLAAWSSRNVRLSDGERPHRFNGSLLSASAFPQLGVTPLVGTVFQETHDRPGAPPVVLLGERVWRDHFARDPGVVGRSILVDGVWTTVLGVLPESFRFPRSEDVWLPLRPDPSASERGQGLFVSPFGRLREDVSLTDAQLEMSLIAERLAAAYPRTNESIGAHVEGFTRQGELVRRIGMTCLGAAAFVLLIACSNVAHLLIARTSARSKELAIRTALGAGRGRMMAQVFAESSCLTLPAALFGLLLAAFLTDAYNSVLAAQTVPYWFKAEIDAAVLWTVMGLMGAAALFSGWIPALRAARLDFYGGIQDESHSTGSSRWSTSLVIFEVALSCALLVGAGLLVRSIVEMTRIDFPFRTDSIFLGTVALPEASYPDAAERRAFFERLDEELGQVPGVDAAALGSSWPGWSRSTRYTPEGKAYKAVKDQPRAHAAVVTPGYFELFNVEVLSGREFNLHDTADRTPVVVVNQSLAEREWPGENPLGKRLRLERGDGPRPWLHVVGVVPDLHMSNISRRQGAGLYRPAAQTNVRTMVLIAATSGEPTAMTDDVRALVARHDPSLPVDGAESLARWIDNQWWLARLLAVIFSIMAGSAMVLAAVSLYSILAFSVHRRTAEVAVRMTLGALSRDVVKLIAGQALRQVLLGLFLGTVLAAALARLMRGALFGVGAYDPWTFAAMAILVFTVAVAAAILPARKAVRVDPVIALRYE